MYTRLEHTVNTGIRSLFIPLNHYPHWKCFTTFTYTQNRWWLSVCWPASNQAPTHPKTHTHKTTRMPQCVIISLWWLVTGNMHDEYQGQRNFDTTLNILPCFQSVSTENMAYAAFIIQNSKILIKPNHNNKYDFFYLHMQSKQVLLLLLF